MLGYRKRFVKRFLVLSMAVGLALPCAARGQGASATAIEPGSPDARIVAALRQVSAEHIRANIEKLVSFGTRATISAQDPESIAAGRGIGAARGGRKEGWLRWA